MSMPRSIEVFKNNRKSHIWFAQCLPAEIDASRFSGPEQILAGAPHIFSPGATRDFSTPIGSMSMPRSIEVLENDRKDPD